MGETRLICPNCGAGYRLDSTMIPPGGRQVECSACSRVWFQPGATSTAPVKKPEVPLAPNAPRLNHPLPQDVLDILTAEAARDQTRRGADANPPMPVHRLSDVPPASPSRHINPAPQSMPDASAPDEMAQMVIRTTPGRPRGVVDRQRSEATVTTRRLGDRSFRSGTMIGLLVAVGALVLYLAAPDLAESGRFGAWLADTRQTVDLGRIWLFDQVVALVDPLIARFR